MHTIEISVAFWGSSFYFSKTTLLNVLAERTEIGVVSGTRFVNGHPLPPDFQAQT